MGVRLDAMSRAQDGALARARATINDKRDSMLHVLHGLEDVVDQAWKKAVSSSTQTARSKSMKQEKSDATARVRLERVRQQSIAQVRECARLTDGMLCGGLAAAV